MEEVAKWITVAGVALVPLIAIWLQWRKNKRWDNLGNVKVDTTRLTPEEQKAVRLFANNTAAIINHRLHQLGLFVQFRFEVWTQDAVPRAGAAATAVRRRDWLFSPAVWHIQTTFYNSRRGEWWWQYCAHEAFGHLAYIAAGKGYNADHKAKEYAPDEREVKLALAESLKVVKSRQWPGV